MSSDDEGPRDESMEECKDSAGIIEQFMELTGCNKTLAKTIVESHPSLETALEYFYGTPQDAPLDDETPINPPGDLYVDVDPAEEDLTGLEISVLSWNIDGLDAANLRTRMKAVFQILDRVNPDFIFLQEVVKNLPYEEMKKLEAKYNVYFSAPEAQYFTGIMTNKAFEVEKHSVLPFQNTRMDRTLQIIEGRLGPAKVFLMNTHLESTAEFSQQRREQFRICMNKMREMIAENPGCLIYFGGDLNIREKEIDQESIPRRVVDAWHAAGSDQQHKFTFDLAKNDNKTIGTASARIRCRFDRIFFYGTLQISSFELQGTQRIRSSLCFPSDHFAVSCVFKL